MGMISGGQDQLSFSPSLVDILSFVNYRDILCCNLVNRRFCDSIRGNQQHLAKPPLEIVIDRDVDLRVVVGDRSKPTTVLKFFKGLVYMNSQHETIRRLLITPSGNKQSQWTCYNAEDLEEEAVNIFTVLFRNFEIGIQFLNIARTEEWTDKWFSVISKAFLRSMSTRSLFLRFEAVIPGIAELATSLRCDYLYIERQGNLDGLKKLTSWKGLLKISYNPANPNPIAPLVDLVELWQDGGCSKMNIEIHLNTMVNDDTEYIFDRLRYEIRDFFAMISPDGRGIYIGRHRDKLKFGTVHCQRNKTIRCFEIRDV